MDYQSERQKLIKEMAAIDCMEKGRLTAEYREVVRDGKPAKKGPYYKHQTWKNGQNISRRVPREEAEVLKNAVEGYHRFRELAEDYVETTVQMTRAANDSHSKKKRQS
ncbi:MAG: DUF6788 family protein [Patescibacteria group bacterium]